MSRFWLALRQPTTALRIITAAMAFFALQASYLGLSYIFGDLRAFDPLFRDKYTTHLFLVRAHGLAASMALCMGLVTFQAWTRRRRVHAWIGRSYGVAVLIGGLTAIPMANMAEGGLSSKLAFLLQALVWLLTMGLAVRAARNKQFSLHRRFMVRNYAVTYSAVVSRLLLTGLQEAGLPFDDLYPVLSWTWLVGLAVGEWWLWYSAHCLERE